MQINKELTLCRLIHQKPNLICRDDFFPTPQIWETNLDVSVEMMSAHCNEASALVTSSQACLKR